MERIIRVVIDLNVFLSSLLGSATCQAVISAIIDGQVTLISSAVLLRDLRRVLTRPKFDRVISPADVARLFHILEARAVLLTPLHPVHVCRDPDDDHLLSLAVEGEAKLLVSGDADLTSLGSYAGVKVLTPRDFLAWLARHPA